MNVYRVKQDSLGAWEFTLRDANGVADITDNTAVKLWMRNEVTGVMKIEGEAVTVVSATAGTVKYEPVAADVDTPGMYEAEFEVEYAGSINERFPTDGYVYIQIVEDLEP